MQNKTIGWNIFYLFRNFQPKQCKTLLEVNCEKSPFTNILNYYYSTGETFVYYSYWYFSYTNVMEENKNIDIVSIWISASNYCISDAPVMSVCLYCYIYSCVVSILLMNDIAILGGKWYSHLSFTQYNENLRKKWLNNKQQTQK